MYAQFSTADAAQSYADAVQQHLMDQNAGRPPEQQYRAERWSDVFQLDGNFYVFVYPEMLPESEHQIVSELPTIEVLP